MSSTVEPLHSAVSSLQQFLSETASDPKATPETVKQRATAADYPYPELASQVFRFLQTKRVDIQSGFQKDDISEAFLSLLLDPQAVEALGAGKVLNPWLTVRQIIRNTGAHLGKSLLDIYETVRETGMGYVPTLMELSHELGTLMRDLGARATDPKALAALAASKVDAWKIALLSMWLRRRKDGSMVPSDQDLEDILEDDALRRALAAEVEGPWEVYGAQAQALRCLRYFGAALESLGDE